MAASEADMEALRRFIAQGGQFSVDAQGNPVANPVASGPSSANAAAGPAVTPADLRAQRHAINAQREADRQADRQAAQQQRQARFDTQQQARQARDQQRADERRRAQEERNAKSARAPFDALTSWVEGLPTPGGNLALLLIILFFAFAIIPVNGGATRLELIYLVLTGRADLPTNAAGTSGNTTTTTPGIAQIGQGIGTAIGAAGSTIGAVGVGLGISPALLPGGGGAGQASGGGPGTAGMNAPVFMPSLNELAPARLREW